VCDLPQKLHRILGIEQGCRTSLADDALHKLRSLEARLPAAIATYFKAPGFVPFPLFMQKKFSGTEKYANALKK
jgi:hypothetical protein